VWSKGQYTAAYIVQALPPLMEGQTDDASRAIGFGCDTQIKEVIVLNATVRAGALCVFPVTSLQDFVQDGQTRPILAGRCDRLVVFDHSKTDLHTVLV
jgi:hypothetical protein